MKVIKIGNPKCKHKLVTMRYNLIPREVRTCCTKCGRVEIVEKHEDEPPLRPLGERTDKSVV